MLLRALCHAMTGPAPFLVTVYDRHARRLLRVHECVTEAAMTERALEEQEMYARFPHVEVECHWGCQRPEVEVHFQQRATREAAPAAR